MGASCKFNARPESEHNQLDLYTRKVMESEDILSSRQVHRSIQNANAPKKKNVFLVFSKNPNQQSELLLKLQQLNSNNAYIIQQYEELTSQQQESSLEIEECFPLTGLSEGSFKAISSGDTERD